MTAKLRLLDNCRSLFPDRRRHTQRRDDCEMSRHTMYALMLGAAVALAVTGGAQATCLSDAGNEDFFVRCPKN